MEKLIKRGQILLFFILLSSAGLEIFGFIFIDPERNPIIVRSIWLTIILLCGFFIYQGIERAKYILGAFFLISAFIMNFGGLVQGTMDKEMGAFLHNVPYIFGFILASLILHGINGVLLLFSKSITALIDSKKA